MKEYFVTKKYLDADEDEGFYVEKIRTGNKDVTRKIDIDNIFEDDDDLVDYIAEVFDQDPDEIEIIEEELKVEFSGDSDKIDPGGAGRIQS